MLSAAIHDIDHPGYNNMFLINNKSDLAIMYNDKSILENHHISLTFRILKEKDCEIFDNISNSDMKEIRRKMISMVLGTDLAVHFKELGNFKTKVHTLSIIV
jgi:hypothetical protein